MIWRASRVPAVTGLLALCAYVGFQFVMQQQARDIGFYYARTAGLHPTRIAALPRPLSPFNWMVVVDTGEQYHYSMISLTARTAPVLPETPGFFAKLGAPYRPVDQARWVRIERLGNSTDAAIAKEVMAHPQFEFFRWFAQYPVLYRIDTEKAETCVWFQDLRFLTPGRSSWPFRYGMCRGNDRQWRAHELLSDNTKIPVH